MGGGKKKKKYFFLSQEISPQKQGASPQLHFYFLCINGILILLFFLRFVESLAEPMRKQYANSS